MQQGKNFKGKTSWKTYSDRFFIVAFVKIIAAFVNAFAIWPRKEKKKKTIATFSDDFCCLWYQIQVDAKFVIKKHFDLKQTKYN